MFFTQMLALLPLKHKLEETAEQLCGDDRAFAMTVFPGLGVPTWAESTNYTEGERLKSLYSEAVKQRVNLAEYKQTIPQQRALSIEYTLQLVLVRLECTLRLAMVFCLVVYCSLSLGLPLGSLS